MATSFEMTYGGLFGMIQTWTDIRSDSALIDNLPALILFAQRRIAREIKVLGLQEYVFTSFTATNGVMAKPSRWLETISMNLGAKDGAVYTTAITNGGSGYQFPPTITGGTATYQAFLTNGVLDQIGIIDGGSGNIPALDLVITNAPLDDTGSSATATATAFVGNNSRKILLPRVYEVARQYWPNSLLVDQPKFYSDYGFNNWLITPTPSDSLPLEVAYYQVADLLNDEHQTNWLTQNAPDLLLYACLLETYPFLQNPDKQAIWAAMYKDAKNGFLTEDQRRIAGRETVRDKGGAAA